MNKTRLQELCQKRRWDLPQYTNRQLEAVREPRFVASVIVNGSVFESPDAESRSVKEAQNKAAAVACEALSAAFAAEAASPAAESSPTESHATFKSQLQIYAQKKRKELPKYTSVSVGPPQALQFKATVVIDGLTFESPKSFKTLREAEHAAAEVALANLPEDSEQNLQDEGAVSYKMLLHEYTQKRKHLLPVYTTVKDPDSSLPLFLSTVEVCGRSFKGVASRTKKQAEASAAKVALDSLEERKQSQVSSSGSSLPVNERHNSCSSDMESKSTVAPVSSSPPFNILTRYEVPENQTSAAQESKPLPADPAQESKTLPANPTQESETLPANPVDEKIQTKDCNLDPAAHSNMGSTVKSSYFEGPACTGSEDSHDEWVGVEPSVIGNKVHVYPLNAGLAMPDGAIRLPFSDNTWVAASLDFP